MVQKQNKAKVSRRQKMLTALDLRAAGASFTQIATALSISRATAWRLIAAGLDELAEESKHAAERVREMEMFRLDKIRMVLWPRRADPRTAEVLLRISERTAKLHGLDAPAKHELTGADGGPIQTEQSGPDLTGLSDEDMAQLDRIHRKMRKEG